MNQKSRKLLVFTGGGIAPALNASLYGVITAAQRRGWRVFGGLLGWACLLPGGKIIDLSKIDVSPIRFQGGSFLRCSRTNPLKDAATTRAVLHTIQRKGFDAIVPIGGDDTLGAALIFWKQYGTPIVGIPKTIDNDLAETYFTPGFPTAAFTLARYTDAIRQAAYGARRIFVIEVMGAKAGWLAAASALGGADVVIPPERPIPLERVLARVKRAYKTNGAYAVVVVAHHATIGKLKSNYAVQRDPYGIRRAHLICLPLRDAIERHVSAETVIALPANAVSAADPIPLDQRSAEALGKFAIGLLAQNRHGTMTILTRQCHPAAIPLSRAAAKTAHRLLTAREFDFEYLSPRPTLLAYLQRITGIANDKERSYTTFLRSVQR